MTGENLIIYVLVPAIAVITLFFVASSVVLMRNNLKASKDVSNKQDELYGLSESIDGKVTTIEDAISNQIAPTVQYLKTGVEELTFKPSMELILKTLEELGVEAQAVTEDGKNIGFVSRIVDVDFTVGFIFHYIEEIEMVSVTSVSKLLTVKTIPDQALLYLMNMNSQIMVGNVFIEEVEQQFPIVCSYSFKANKSNIDKQYFSDVVKRLAASHHEVSDSLLKLGIESEDMGLNQYLELQNIKMKEANKQIQRTP